MKDFIRRMVIPFFMLLFPAVWYINRNVLTDRLPPRVEPTTDVVALSIGVAVLGSLLFGTAFAVFWRYDDVDMNYKLPYPQRVFQPDTTALGVFSCFIGVTVLWAIFEMGGVGPLWFGDAFYVLLTPIVVPFLVLAPLVIQFHWAVIVGLVFSVLWMSFLATIVSDIIHGRPLPLMGT